MYNKNDPSQFPSYLRPNIIKSENEIYMIKDNNKNKINEILKTIHSAKNIEKIGIDEDVKKNNESLINSITTTRDLFRKYFNIKETKKKYDDKLEKKYQSFHKYLKKRNREDYLQKGINMSYRKQYKIAEKTEQNKN
jgi:hypothetical protein